MNDCGFEEGPETCFAREAKVRVRIILCIVVNLNFPTLQDAPPSRKSIGPPNRKKHELIGISKYVRIFFCEEQDSYAFLHIVLVPNNIVTKRGTNE